MRIKKVHLGLIQPIILLGNKGHAKSWGVNKVYYGECENGEYCRIWGWTIIV